MTRVLDPEPWRGLPERVADVIEPELDAITDEILATIAREVPEYARPLEGSFGRGVRTGWRSAGASFARAGRSTRCSPRTGSARVWHGGGWLRRHAGRGSAPT
jgi:hypothetical protein